MYMQRATIMAAGAMVLAACSPFGATANKASAPPALTAPPTTDPPTTVTSTTIDASTTLATEATTAPTEAATTVPIVVTIPPVTVAQPPVRTTQPSVRAAETAPIMGGFEACVALRESGNNPHVGFGGLYGILPSTWHSLGYSGVAGNADVATQQAAFNQLYAKYGKTPWSAYDGCP
jgi:hypothetical protein